MAFLPPWYGLLCSLIVINVLFETGVSGSSNKSNPLEADDILTNHTFGNHHQCQKLCWYMELCERFSFYMKNVDNAHPYNCVLHASEEKDDDVLDGWMQEKASGDYLPSEHGCRNRTCGKEKVCVPLAMPDVKNVCNDLPADVNECASNLCQNGSCVDGDRIYTCNCSAGFTGVHCETDIDECASNPCQNGGNCVDQVNAYTCNCCVGYNGSNCETDTPTATECPTSQGYMLMNSTQPPLCLRLNAGPKLYDAAQAACEEEGANLVRVKTLDIYNVVKNFLVDAGHTDWVLIGANDKQTEGEFYWNDCAPLPLGSDMWYHPTREGYNEHEDCTALSTSKKIIDTTCDKYPQAFVCQLDVEVC